MKRIKTTAFAIFGAAILTAGLYACSNDSETNSATEVTTEKKINTTSEDIILTLVHGNKSVEFKDLNNFSFIDEQGDYNPVRLSGTEETYETVFKSSNEILIKKITSGVQIATIYINSENETEANFDIAFSNGYRISNISVQAKGGKWKWIGKIFDEISDWFSGGSTELDEMVIYDMKDCYRNHQIAMQNCVGGSVSLIADQSTGQCSIGNCVR